MSCCCDVVPDLKIVECEDSNIDHVQMTLDFIHAKRRDEDILRMNEYKKQASKWMR